jgi:hypothetical protein
MDAIFVELPAFERRRHQYLDDQAYGGLQEAMMMNPQGGKLIKESGGMRKFRYSDKRRGKGTRGGLRVIYYYWAGGAQFWLFTLYDKSEQSDLTARQRADLKSCVKLELEARQRP